MNREEIAESITNAQSNEILCELPTGVGKTRLALDFIGTKEGINKILIVVPRLVLINNWKDEIRKWGYERLLPSIEFVTYVSFPKKVGVYDVILFDEVHHFSERCRDAFTDFRYKYVIMLSATVGRNMRKELNYMFRNLEIFHISPRKAIEGNIIPDPKVFLLPISLDNQKINCQIIKNKSQKSSVRCLYGDRFKYANVKNKKIIIDCTERQYYEDLSSLIVWYKKKASFSSVFKNMFLHKSGERIKWLSQRKTEYVKDLLKILKNKRTLTFCSSIAQTEELGDYCINSKNVQAKEFLDSFNNHEINHITACDMLNEGCNLVDCQYGIYASLHSSERLITQQLGRILRHPEPILIIPYFMNTRDEEIVKKMLENYNPELVTTITNRTKLNEQN